MKVVIPTFNGEEHIARCIDSLIVYYSEEQIVIVDNGSTDGTVNLIKNRFPELMVIENESNQGYSGACNIGASVVDSELIMFLNQDAEFTHLDSEGLDRIFDDPNLGIIAGPVFAEDGEQIPIIGKPMTIGLILKNWLGLPLLFLGVKSFRMLSVPNSDIDEMANLPWVSGHLIIVRRSLFEKIGGWDEGYFVYVVETDLCHRATEAGFGVGFSKVVSSRDFNGLRNNTSEMTSFVVHDSLLGHGRFVGKKHGAIIGKATRVICSLASILWGFVASIVFVLNPIRRKSSLNLMRGGWLAIRGIEIGR